MKKSIIILLLMLSGAWAMAQNRTISGIVTDKDGGETMIGVKIVESISGKGAVTNSFGRYSLTLPQGKVCLRVIASGYETRVDTLALVNDTVINFAMQMQTQLSGVLHEVVIRGERPTDASSSQMSAVSIPVEQIKAVPVLFGEADVLKAIQLMPGVQSGSEGMSGMYVRGGGPDENLFLLDGVPLYNVNHLAGFFSAFNSDAIKDITLYKGSFPAHFGGRLSSVLDITQNDGNDREMHGNFSIGAIAAKLNIEGPIIREKTTFSLSARRTYGDALILPFVKGIGLLEDLNTSFGYYFYDFNAKVAHKFSDRSRLFLSYYSGDDKLYFKVKTRGSYWDDEKLYIKMGYAWGNMVTSARWNYVLTPKLFMNATAAYTRYRNNLSIGAEEMDSWGSTVEKYNIDMYYNSGIEDYTARVDFDYQPNPDHTMKFGTFFLHHIFRPEVMGGKVSDQTTENGVNYLDTMSFRLGESLVHANEINAYFEDDWHLSDAFKLNLGLALSGFAVQEKFYFAPQPRLSGRMLLSDVLSLKAGYAYTTQYLHLLSNSNISMPNDLWVPVTAKIAPMNAHQVAAGLFYNWKHGIDFSVEGYFKKMDNLMEYRDGANFLGGSQGWEEKVCLGEGWAYGVEFLAQKTVGKVSGWVGYTWSKALRRFPDISQGEIFPAKYDRRHDLSIVLMYKPNDQFDCSLTWVYNTGNAATLATQQFEDGETGYEYDYYSGRNNYRMPAYHRMDASVNFHKQKKRGVRTWNISVYNLYNHQNPYILMVSNQPYESPSGTLYPRSLMQYSIFPIIPSVSYQFKF